MSGKKLFYFGILPALLFQMLGTAFYFLWDSEFSQWIYSATKLTLLLWPLLWLASFRKNIPGITSGKGGKLTGVLVGLLFAGLIFLIFELGLNPDLEGIQEKAASFGLLSPTRYLLFAIFLSLAHALLEEYYWRWFVFRGLQLKFSWSTAAIIGSAAFAGHHFFILSAFFSLPLTLILGTAVGIGGFIWCFLYHKTNSLWAPYLSHVLVDGVLMLIGYTILF
ncbi:MAG: CPBP family intramembrane glutamic endopeptidase [Candidatus Gracilibacteria bacterium]